MQNIATYICLFLSQYLIPIGIDAGSWKFYFFFEGWLLIQLVVVYFFFIETRGATLEEINKTFDGADAVEEIKQKALEVDGVKDVRDFGEDDVAHHVEEVNEKTS